jgi:TonB family protein
MKNRILNIAFVFAIFFNAFSYNAQVVPPQPMDPPIDEMDRSDYIVIPDEQVFDGVEQQPEFPGGQEAMFNFLVKNLTYPELALERSLQGRVYVQFLVCKDGSVKDIKVLRGIETSLDNEAIRVIKMMPKWKPGTFKGKPVNVMFNLPINFKINGDNPSVSNDNSSENIDNKIIRAKQMILQGYKLKKVCKETGLSKDRVKDLKKEVK